MPCGATAGTPNGSRGSTSIRRRQHGKWPFTIRCGCCRRRRGSAQSGHFRPTRPASARPELERPVASLQRAALDCDTVHQPALAVIVVDREMPGRAVVPQRQRPLPPVEAAGEFGPYRVPVEVAEQRPGLLVAPALEAERKARIDVE